VHTYGRHHVEKIACMSDGMHGRHMHELICQRVAITTVTTTCAAGKIPQSGQTHPNTHAIQHVHTRTHMHTHMFTPCMLPRLSPTPTANIPVTLSHCSRLCSCFGLFSFA
jgi:hypothetical protein